MKWYSTHYFYVAVILFNIGLCRSARKGVLRNFAKPIGKHPCLSLFLNKVAGLRPATFLKMRLWHRRSPLNSAKPPRTSSSLDTSGRLLLSLGKLAFHLFVPPVFFCFESSFLNQDTKICVITLCNFVM